MKVAQKNQTNLDARFVYLSDASNYLNMELSPSFPLSGIRLTPGIHPRMFIPSACNM